jgi:hypothetical protein
MIKTILPNWVNVNLANQIARNIHQKSEFPDIVTFYSPDVAQSMSNSMEWEILPSDENRLLHSSKGLLSRDAEFIYKRLDRFSKVNLIDMAETTGDSSLPLILELIQGEKMSKYIPATPNQTINDLAIRRLRLFAINIRSSLKSSESIIADLEVSDFKTLALDALRSDEMEDTGNLFIMMNSRLGNSPNPQLMLKNVYNTMSQGDFFVLLQGIYRSGSEDILASDYGNLYTTPGSFIVAKSILTQFNPEPEYISYWEDSDKFMGVKVKVKVAQDISIAGAEIATNQEIDVFTSHRFDESRLKNMLKTTGFKIIDVAYDETMDHGLFFMEK